MLLRVLGPLQVDGADGPVGVGGPVPRRVLVALLADPGETVSTDRLVLSAWGDQAPASAERTLQSHLTRLREALGAAAPHAGAAALERVAGGYRVAVAREDVDTCRFEDLVDRARDEPPTVAAATLRAAMALWRADLPYPELLDTAHPEARAAALVERRAAAREQLVEALLSADDPAGATDVARDALRADPYRERLWELLVLALYRQGRQADALAAYREARSELVDGLGIEPGPSLRSMEDRVLAQDPGLLTPRSARRPPCPYRGLARYETEDADLFVGRERLVQEVVGRLVDGSFVVLTGPSGAGKSSLLRAGLLPAVAAGALPGSSSWRVEVAVPRPDDRFRRPGGSAPSPDLLVLDQVEEALRSTSEDTAAAMVERVRAVLTQGGRVVLALRADHYGALAAYPELARRAGPATVLVGPPDDGELRRIVVEPAQRAGLTVEPALVDAVVAEVRGRPGVLPVLSTALVRAWAQRDGDAMTLAAYRSAGGVTSALERAGEDAWAAMPDDATRSAARRVLIRLADQQDGTWVRRRVHRSDLVASDPQAAAALAVLADHRLVVMTADDVEIVHESLLTGWPRLRGWLEDGRTLFDTRERLVAAAAAWEQDGRDAQQLLRGARLAAALEAVAERPEDVGEREREFLAEGERAAGEELARERQRADREAVGRRRTRAIAAGLTVALVLAGVAGGIALRNQRAAEQVATTAAAERLGALARATGDLDRALLLAAQAVTLEDSAQTESDLFATLLRAPRVLAAYRAPGRIQSVAFGPSSYAVVAVSPNGVVTGWDPDGRQSLVVALEDAVLYGRQVVVTPDGEVLVSGGDAYGPSVLDLATGDLLSRGVPGMSSLAFAVSPDGDRVVAGAAAAGWRLGPEVLVWDRSGGGVLRTTIGSGVTAAQPCGAQVACVVTEDGRLLRVGYDDAGVRSEVTLPPDVYGAPATSADGTRAAFASDAGVVRVLDTRTGAAVAELGGSGSDAVPLSFSPNGERLVGASFDTTVVWRLDEPGFPEHATVNGGQVQAAAWSHDGTTFVTGSEDGTVLIWDATGHRGIGPAFSTGLAEASTMWPVPGFVLLGGTDGDMRWVDATTGLVRASGDHTSAIETVRTGLTGPRMVTASEDGTIALWRNDMWIRDFDLPPLQEGYEAATWVSPDGERAATVRDDRGPVVVELETGEVRRLNPLPPPPASEAPGVVASGIRSTAVQGWSPDGGALLLTRSDTAGANAEVMLVDADSGALRWVASTGAGAVEATVDPAGRFVAVGLNDGRLRILDPVDGHELVPPLRGNAGFVYNVSVSPDGRYLAASGAPPGVTVWDTRTFTQVGTGLPVDFAASDARARFGPDGRLYAISGSTLRRFDIDPSVWLRQACAVVGRPLTEQEWAELLPDRDYAPACA